MFLRKIFIPLLIMVVSIAAWLLRPERDSADAPEAEVFPELSKIEPLLPEPEAALQADPVHVNERVDPAIVEHVVPEEVAESSISVEAATEPILQLLPEWLLEEGDVRRERIQVAGHWADRVRSRYAWSNGSLVEVEVSDLGSNAAPGQFKALGFDFELEEETTNGNLRVAVDGEEYVSNLEYSEDDGSGQVQYIVAGRYLMEVQLENLPLDSFQSLEDRDGLFAALQQYASE